MATYAAVQAAILNDMHRSDLTAEVVKNNIDAWWISISTFAVLVVTLLLLTFMGDALRDALDPRKLKQEAES